MVSARAAQVEPTTCQDGPLCHCLDVSRDDVLACLARCPERSLSDVMRETGAGRGCMACHRHIRRLLTTQELG